MKRNKLLKTLAEFFDKEEQKKQKHHDELEKLLHELKEKEAKLEVKLREEKNEQKRKRLDEELKIAKAQHAKGIKTLQSLET